MRVPLLSLGVLVGGAACSTTSSTSTTASGSCATDAALFKGVGFPDLQSALSTATGGGTVTVCSGTHTGTFTSSFSGDLVLESESGASAILDAGGLGTTLSVQGSSGATLTLRGLTIQGGASPVAVRDGGGLLFTGGSDLTIEDCVIQDNDAGSQRNGGGVYVGLQSVGGAQTTATFHNVQVLRNIASYEGGGIDISAEDLVFTLTESHFEDNEAGYGAGGLKLGSRYHDVEAYVGSTRFVHNHAGYEAGGVGVIGTRVQLEVADSSFEQNHSGSEAGGLEVNAIDTPAELQVAVSDTVFFSNTADHSGGGAVFGSRYTGAASYQLVDVTFDGNSAGNTGGGVDLEGEPFSGQILRGHFLDNEGMRGGALSMGGVDSSGTLSLEDSVLERNAGRRGAAVHLEQADGALTANHLTLTGCTLTENAATGDPDELADGELAAVSAREAAMVTVVDTDLGSGALDNTPLDFEGCSQFGAGASFAYEPDAGDYCVP